jgi:hypothetical protein
MPIENNHKNIVNNQIDPEIAPPSPPPLSLKPTATRGSIDAGANVYEWQSQFVNVSKTAVTTTSRFTISALLLLSSTLNPFSKPSNSMP